MRKKPLKTIPEIEAWLLVIEKIMSNLSVIMEDLDIEHRYYLMKRLELKEKRDIDQQIET